MRLNRYVLFPIACILFSLVAAAQAESEIQVYASPTVDKGTTMFELHSNYTFKGMKYLPDQKLAHYLNESLEITHGFTDNFEVGFYIFTAVDPNGKYRYLGSHIRPRIAVPDSWHWKVGASISAEFGFFRQDVNLPFHWEGEIRPIIDKTVHNWYFAINPNVDFILNGEEKHWGFGPQVKVVYTIQQKVGVGIEYYTEVGTFQKINPFSKEE